MAKNLTVGEDNQIIETPIVKSPEEIAKENREKIVALKKLQSSKAWFELMKKYHDEAKGFEIEILERGGTAQDDEVTVSEAQKDRRMEELFSRILKELPDVDGSAYIAEGLKHDIDCIQHNRLKAAPLMNVGIGLVSRSAPLYTELDILRFKYHKLGDMDQALARFIHEATSEANVDKKDENVTDFETGPSR
jgi:hypothetical protein